MWLLKALLLPAVVLLLIISLNAFADGEIRLGPGGSLDFETRGGDRVRVTCSSGDDGGGGDAHNICRCRGYDHSPTDRDYVLEYFDQNARSWRVLETYNSSDPGPEDLQNCQQTRRVHPDCF